MKRFSILLASVFGLMALTTSCNDEWTEEQYEKYISFKAPLDADNGVTSVYVPLTRHITTGEGEDKVVTDKYGPGISDYNLPIIVSGTTKNDRDITVHVGHDTDTLGILNYAWFQNRTDLYYKDMSDYVTYPNTATIKAGEDIGLLNLKFDFNANGGIDMVEKWVLPLTIVDKKENGESYGYDRHPRKNYAKALLRVFPFNNWSGDYSATTITVGSSPVSAAAAQSADGTGLEYCRAYAMSDNEVFFYAGSVDETRTDRGRYKIKATFKPSEADPLKGTVEFSCDNPLMQFETKGEASYSINEKIDDVQQYLLHRYVIISDISYTFRDYTVMGEDYYDEHGEESFMLFYAVKGTMTLGRQINTQIPDEDQAIDW